MLNKSRGAANILNSCDNSNLSHSSEYCEVKYFFSFFFFFQNQSPSRQTLIVYSVKPFLEYDINLKFELGVAINTFITSVLIHAVDACSG